MIIFKQTIMIFLLVVILLAGVLYAGSFSPTPSHPDISFVNLSDIYSKLEDSTSATSSRSFAPESTPAETNYTLQAIYNLISTPSADSIILGETIRGVEGTYDISNLTPDQVRADISYGTSSVGTWVAEPAPVPDYVVTGDGDGSDGSPNGNYFENGTESDQPRYIGPSPADTFKIYFDGSGSWSIRTYPVPNINGFFGPSPAIEGSYLGTAEYTGSVTVSAGS